MLNWLLPKKNEFFTLFSKHAALCVDSTKLLAEFLEDLSNPEEKAKKIKAVEHDADTVTHDTMEMLQRSFITPIERGDIHRIASSIDDVVDHVEAASQRIYLYEIHEARPEAIEMARVLVHSAMAVERAVSALPNLKEAEAIRKVCKEINQFEHECDTLLRLATARLFREEKNPLEVIKWKEIYDNIESATDRCEDVANVVEGVVIENT